MIRQMTIDLSFPIEIMGIDTERAADGLALSSRNGYLTAEQRAIAPTIYQQLQWVKQQVLSGANDYRLLEQQVASHLMQHSFRPDYIHIVDRATLEPANDHNKPLVVLLAAYLGNTRLIDNLEI